jgi:LPS-assembly protein
MNSFEHTNNENVTGKRLDIQPRLSLPIRRAAWYVEPAVGVRHTMYRLDNTAADANDSPGRTTPVASIDAGSFFDRNTHWGDTDLVQTLEPRLFYLYVPYKNQDDIPVFDTGDYDFNFWTLFQENRFTGPDRMGDANQLALALTSRMLVPDSGRELFRASLGSLLYFRDRDVTLPDQPVETDDSSDLIGEFTVNLGRNWNADADVQWNPHNSQTDRNDYRLQYRAGPRQLVNLSYRRRRDSQEQADLSFLWPLGRSWHMVGRWYYSMDANETLEAIAGLGYESCCWAARLVGRSYTNSDQNNHNTEVFFQMELKGLGRLGSRVDDVLDRGILGYQPGF